MYVYFLVFESFAEIVVDRLVADFGEQGEVCDAYFLLARSFVDGLLYHGLLCVLFGSCGGSSFCGTTGSFCDSLQKTTLETRDQRLNGISRTIILGSRQLALSTVRIEVERVYRPRFVLFFVYYERDVGIQRRRRKYSRLCLSPAAAYFFCTTFFGCSWSLFRPLLSLFPYPLPHP